MSSPDSFDVISREPLLAIADVTEASDNLTSRILVGSGVLNVFCADRVMPPRRMEYAKLASIGLANADIADRLGVVECTVKNQLRFIGENLAVSSKTGMVQALMSAGIYEIDEPAEPLVLSPSEQRVVTGAAAGLRNEQTGKWLYLSPHTVHEHLSHVAMRSGWHGRGSLGLVALMSGQVELEAVQKLRARFKKV